MTIVTLGVAPDPDRYFLLAGQVQRGGGTNNSTDNESQDDCF